LNNPFNAEAGHPEEKAAALRCGLQLRGDKSFDPNRQVDVALQLTYFTTSRP
jgi:hypothetical protein